MDYIETLMNIVVAVFTVIGLWVTLGKAIKGVYTEWNQHRQGVALKRKSLQGHYDDHTIENATRYYIWPQCSNIDPSHQEEISQALVATRESLRDKVDDFLKEGDAKRHLLILADSGTGKTSFLLNYFAYNLRRWKRNRHNIQLIHLGSSDCDDRIRSIQEPENTVLFLDALDEDVRAIAGHGQRIEKLMELCKRFSHIVITCRTQFFPREEEIPKETGIAQIGPRKAGEPGVYKFWRLYLSPLDDDEVRRYVSRRYPIWRYRHRAQAKAMALKIPLLCARPMLLAHIPDIVESKEPVDTVGNLYRVMVNAWVERETAWVDKAELRRFSEGLAADIYANRKARGGESIPTAQLAELAAGMGITLEPWQMAGRSLLNRDAEGNFKFAHRSIMEYLVTRQIWGGNRSLEGIVLTDQIQAFIYESLPQRTFRGNRSVIYWRDLNGSSLAGVINRVTTLGGTDRVSTLWGEVRNSSGTQVYRVLIEIRDGTPRMRLDPNSANQDKVTAALAMPAGPFSWTVGGGGDAGRGWQRITRTWIEFLSQGFVLLGESGEEPEVELIGPNAWG